MDYENNLQNVYAQNFPIRQQQIYETFITISDFWSKCNFTD